MINNFKDIGEHARHKALISLFGRLSRDRGEDLTLEQGSRIAVIGGGPAGTFFSIFALKFAKIMGRDIKITIFEPKDFLAKGIDSCNHCGGIISEIMVQNLTMEGIHIPRSVIHRGISGYLLHTETGDVRIETPANEKTIASVFRGGSGDPPGIFMGEKECFDAFLLKEATLAGAEHRPLMIDKVIHEGNRPVLYSSGKRIMDADLVVGAFGVNSPTTPTLEGNNQKKTSPVVTKAAIAEIVLSKAEVQSRFDTSVHLFLLPIKDISFAAIIPKRSYVTLCILGKDMDQEKVEEFLHHPKVRHLFPEHSLANFYCVCLPWMNIGASPRPHWDRIVLIGDSGSNRLYKDGIGGAYLMGKSAARTVVMHGIGKEHFRKHYLKDYKNLTADNRYARALFFLTDIIRVSRFLSSVILDVVRREHSNDTDTEKAVSSILWDMFTGNEPYRNIFYRSFAPDVLFKMTRSFAVQVLRSLQ